MEQLLIFILGQQLYNTLLEQYPLFLGVMSFLFMLQIILLFFNLFGSVINGIR